MIDKTIKTEHKPCINFKKKKWEKIEEYLGKYFIDLGE